jgi:hypothetical protein
VGDDCEDTIMGQLAIDPTGAREATTAPLAASPAPRPQVRVKISALFLLGIYAIVPLCLLAMVLDSLFWGGKLCGSLPTSPEHLFLFQLLFGTPHIIASSVILVTNTDYLRAYWLRVVLFSLVLLVFFGVGSLFIPYDGFLAIVGTATVLHVIKQQVGIGKGICRVKSWVYEAWGWTLVLFGSVLYFAIYTSQRFSPETEAWVHRSLWVLGGVALGLTFACHQRITTLKGHLYLWANTVMVLQSGLFYMKSYFFLAILGPRLVHDITAFTFYVAHDVNRYSARPNLIYRLASKLRLGIFWICPAMAVLLTYLITSYTDTVARFLGWSALEDQLKYGATFIIVGYLGLLHYFTETFTWRHGSAYRQHVVLTG